MHTQILLAALLAFLTFAAAFPISNSANTTAPLPLNIRYDLDTCAEKNQAVVNGTSPSPHIPFSNLR